MNKFNDKYNKLMESFNVPTMDKRLDKFIDRLPVPIKVGPFSIKINEDFISRENLEVIKDAIIFPEHSDDVEIRIVSRHYGVPGTSTEVGLVNMYIKTTDGKKLQYNFTISRDLEQTFASFAIDDGVYQFYDEITFDEEAKELTDDHLNAIVIKVAIDIPEEDYDLEDLEEAFKIPKNAFVKKATEGHDINLDKFEIDTEGMSKVKAAFEFADAIKNNLSGDFEMSFLSWQHPRKKSNVLHTIKLIFDENKSMTILVTTLDPATIQFRGEGKPKTFRDLQKRQQRYKNARSKFQSPQEFITLFISRFDDETKKAGSGQIRLLNVGKDGNVLKSDVVEEEIHNSAKQFVTGKK